MGPGGAHGGNGQVEALAAHAPGEEAGPDLQRAAALFDLPAQPGDAFQGGAEARRRFPLPIVQGDAHGRGMAQQRDGHLAAIEPRAVADDDDIAELMLPGHGQEPAEAGMQRRLAAADDDPEGAPAAQGKEAFCRVGGQV